MKRSVFISLVALFLFQACGENRIPDPEDCPAELLCTEEFVSLIYRPTVNGELTPLDSYYSQNLDNGNTYNFVDPTMSQLWNAYIVISDGEFEEIQKEGTTIRFFGIRDNEVVIEEDFVVGHDCCHVIPLEGPFAE